MMHQGESRATSADVTLKPPLLEVLDGDYLKSSPPLRKYRRRCLQAESSSQRGERRRVPWQRCFRLPMRQESFTPPVRSYLSTYQPARFNPLYSSTQSSG